MSFWTEMETSIPGVAGASTGIPDFECIWRIEWRLSFERARQILKVGEDRWFTGLRPAREYQNRAAVTQSEVLWHEMESDMTSIDQFRARANDD
jgi:hypothetical protein